MLNVSGKINVFKLLGYSNSCIFAQIIHFGSLFTQRSLHVNCRQFYLYSRPFPQDHLAVARLPGASEFAGRASKFCNLVARRASRHKS